MNDLYVFCIVVVYTVVMGEVLIISIPSILYRDQTKDRHSFQRNRVYRHLTTEIRLLDGRVRPRALKMRFPIYFHINYKINFKGRLSWIFFFRSNSLS